MNPSVLLSLASTVTFWLGVPSSIVAWSRKNSVMFLSQLGASQEIISLKRKAPCGLDPSAETIS